MERVVMVGLPGVRGPVSELPEGDLDRTEEALGACHCADARSACRVRVGFILPQGRSMLVSAIRPVLAKESMRPRLANNPERKPKSRRNSAKGRILRPARTWRGSGAMEQPKPRSAHLDPTAYHFGGY